jgi:hypothetical protein
MAFLDDIATKRDLKELERKITIKIGMMVVALGGLLAAIKFFG